MKDRNLLGWKSVRRAATAASLLPILMACSDSRDGPYGAQLLLQGPQGERRAFDLGVKANIKTCSELGVLEVSAAEEDGGVFWTNPQFTYGGAKEADDWIGHQVLGFVCVKS